MKWAVLRFPVMFLHIVRNMGLRYTLFRLWYESQKKLGILKWRFSKRRCSQSFVSIDDFRSPRTRFFFDPGQLNIQTGADLMQLKFRRDHIARGRFQYFHHQWYEVSDWHTNPINGFRYSPKKHWSAIADFLREEGDIKYVWEKSRFTFLYDLIRFDAHFGEDQSRLVFALIESWINKNPVNCGPNWCCGQEITLRVLNWTFALHYYRHSKELNQALLNKILGSICDQIKRVSANIHFSRIAVRNNHALTETLGLYLIGLLFPFLPESAEWKKCGKVWFEEEVAFQIAADGSYLQSSMNYHRVVAQLMVWAVRLAEANGERWSAGLYQNAQKSLLFLMSCQDPVSGWLPNYGSNDGALFFPLTSCHFRDFRPQLAALAATLKRDHPYGAGCWNEEAEWLSGKTERTLKQPIRTEQLNVFENGGYYTIRDGATLTFLRCGRYIHRPHQADHLHLDIWVNGTNLFRDAGTFRYNATAEEQAYFSGTASHNTIMLGEFDQMRRQSRFIWEKWIRTAGGRIYRQNDDFIIEGAFEGFRHIAKGIRHQRKVFKQIGQHHWIVQDQCFNVPAALPMRQIWHPSPDFFEHYQILAYDENRIPIGASRTEGWYSDTYGSKTPACRLVFSTCGRHIHTVISSKNHH
jgi:hypothetical protein